MKVRGAWFVSLFFLGMNQALALYCDRPQKPYVPAGYISERYAMESAKSDLERYQRRMKDYIECLNSEAENAANEHRTIVREWNDSVSSYNRR